MKTRINNVRDWEIFPQMLESHHREKILRFFFDQIEPNPTGTTKITIIPVDNRLLVQYTEENLSYTLRREGAATQPLSEFHENWRTLFSQKKVLYKTETTKEEIDLIRKKVDFPCPKDLGKIFEIIIKNGDKIVAG